MRQKPIPKQTELTNTHLKHMSFTLFIACDKYVALITLHGSVGQYIVHKFSHVSNFLRELYRVDQEENSTCRVFMFVEILVAYTFVAR